MRERVAIARAVSIAGHPFVVALVLLLRLDWRFGAAMAIVVPLVAWSRLALARHTVQEVLGGACLGLAAGALLIVW